eukprot:1852536-Pyramimonas_sp.AAC.1
MPGGTGLVQQLLRSWSWNITLPDDLSLAPCLHSSTVQAIPRLVSARGPLYLGEHFVMTLGT